MTQSAVDPGQQVTDALLDDPRTTDSTIDVANDRGIITLTGKVDSIEIRQAAEEVARRQEGVVTVINDLKLSKDW